MEHEMNAELAMLLLKTTGGGILLAIAWLFRRGGRISLRLGVDFGGPSRAAKALPPGTKEPGPEDAG